VVSLYLRERTEGERFLDMYRRVGMEPFKNIAYQEQMNAAYNG
jgi:sulfite reductase (NADPH) hemoprotein beta-component